MSVLTDTLIDQLNILLASGSDITATEHRAFELQVIAAIGQLESRERGNTIGSGDLNGAAPNPASPGMQGDLFVAIDTRDLWQFQDGEWVWLFNFAPQASAFVPVLANAYGLHPAFNSEREWDIWLTQRTGGGGGITPALPTIATYTLEGKQGALITVTGTGFVAGATAVTIGNIACDNVVVTSTTTLTCRVAAANRNGTFKVATAAGSVNGATPFAVIAPIGVLGGQSNGEGAAPAGELTTDPVLASKNLTGTFPRGFMWNTTTTAAEGLHVGGVGVGNQMGYTYDSHFDGYGTMFGPEVGIADVWQRNNPGPIWLAKFCWGGQLISAFLDGGAYAGRLDTAVNGLIAYLTAQGYTPRIEGMLWNQWEANAIAGTSTADYRASLEALYTDIRSKWMPADAKFVVVLAGGSLDVKEDPGAVSPNGKIRVAQLGFIAAHAQARFLDSLDYARLTTEPIHYRGVGQYLQGSDFLNALTVADNSLPLVEDTTTIIPVPDTWQDLVFSPLTTGFVRDSSGNYSTTFTDGTVHPGGLSPLVSGDGAYGLKFTYHASMGANVIVGWNAINAFAMSPVAYQMDFALLFNAAAAAGGASVAPGPHFASRILGTVLQPYQAPSTRPLVDGADYATVKGVGRNINKMYFVQRLPGATDWTWLDTVGYPLTPLHPQAKYVAYGAYPVQLGNPQVFGLS